MSNDIESDNGVPAAQCCNNFPVPDDLLSIHEGDHILALRAALEQHHPMAGMFGAVFADLGGEQFLREWGDANPGAFIRLMVGMMPAVAPTSSKSGELTVNINTALGRTDLDNVIDVAVNTNDD